MTKNKKSTQNKKTTSKTTPKTKAAKSIGKKKQVSVKKEESKLATTNRAEFRKIPIDMIDIDPRNPRKTIDDNDIDELAEAIKATGGLLQPVGARTNGDRWMLIFGQRRFFACRKLGFDTIDALVHNVSDDEALSMAIMENLQRVNVDPVEEADSLAELQRLGHDIREIANRLGKGPHWTAARLKLAKMSDDIKGMVSRGEITLRHIESIAKIDDPSARRQLAKESRFKSVGEIEAMIKRMTRIVSTAPFPATLSVKGNNGMCGPCDKCIKRSDKQNDLFGPSEKAICTDPSCWETLLEAQRIKIIAKLKKQGFKILSDDGYIDASNEVNGWTTKKPKGDAKFTEFLYVTKECETEVYFKTTTAAKQENSATIIDDEELNKDLENDSDWEIGGVKVFGHQRMKKTRDLIRDYLADNVDQIGFGKSLAIILLSNHIPEEIGEAYQKQSEVLEANIPPIDLMKIGLRLSNLQNETLVAVLSMVQGAPSIQEFADKATQEEST